MNLSTDIRTPDKTLEDFHRDLLQQLKADHDILTAALTTNSGEIGNLKRFTIELDAILKKQAQTISSQAIANTDEHFKNFAGNYTEALRQCVSTLRVATEAVKSNSDQLNTVAKIVSNNSLAISDLAEYLKTSKDTSDKRLEAIEKILLGIVSTMDKKSTK